MKAKKKHWSYPSHSDSCYWYKVAFWMNDNTWLSLCHQICMYLSSTDKYEGNNSPPPRLPPVLVLPATGFPPTVNPGYPSGIHRSISYTMLGGWAKKHRILDSPTLNPCLPVFIVLFPDQERTDWHINECRGQWYDTVCPKSLVNFIKVIRSVKMDKLLAAKSL